ncbi:hypothetical protein [Hellea balneolensis]|uniref:hypothetical protein n=1 Tax=Hellea balneolensis TaxID=287478 RepID=UPI00041BBE24|nr:hypothetical protein [Hellea balneolensis]
MTVPVSIKALLGAVAAIAMTACEPKTESPQDAFFDDLKSHCGKAYAGKLVSNDAVDADFGSKKMIMHVRDCSDTVLRIPFHVGDDHSRTWVISKTANGLRLKHDHRHEDGSEDAVTQYGGDTIYEGARSRQVFPVDQYSIDMFLREGLDVSIVNIWAVEINNAKFAYELSRPNRHFRVEFDVTQPVDLPPAPWGM